MILRQYLVERRITITEFAERLDMSRGYMSQVVLGNSIPSAKLRKRIFIETGGAVTPEDFEKPQTYFDIHREGNNVVVRES